MSKLQNNINNEPAAEYKTDISKPITYSSLSDSELLARVSGHKITTCRDELNTFKSLHGIEKNTGLLDACLELSQRYIYETIERSDALCSPKQTRDYLKLKLSHLEHEVFAVLFLDNRNRVIAFDEMFTGTIDGASVYPREVIKRALEHNAAAVIFSHNHPSGVAEPSNADEMITKRLKDALSMVDIRVLDHFIIGDEVISFAERGLI